MGEPNTLRLRDEPEELVITIKTPGAAQFYDFNSKLIMPVQKFVCDFAHGCFVGELKSGRAVPLNIDNGDQPIWQDTSDGRVSFQVFELCHFYATSR